MTTYEVRCIARHLTSRYATAYELAVAYTSGGPRLLIRDLMDCGALQSTDVDTREHTFAALLALAA